MGRGSAGCPSPVGQRSRDRGKQVDRIGVSSAAWSVVVGNDPQRESDPGWTAHHQCREALPETLVCEA